MGMGTSFDDAYSLGKVGVFSGKIHCREALCGLRRGLLLIPVKTSNVVQCRHDLFDRIDQISP
jgi:hypothetical protein